MNNFIPNDRTIVTIPWWLDCRPWDVFLSAGYESSNRFLNCRFSITKEGQIVGFDSTDVATDTILTRRSK